MRDPLQKILYVEDDEDIAELITLALQKIGKFEVKRCDSGKNALATFPEFHPQMVVMDVMMPDMDGVETFEHLKKMPEAKETPVVFMTAKAQTNEQKKYLEMGAMGVIVKPCEPVSLCRQLNRYWEIYNEE